MERYRGSSDAFVRETSSFVDINDHEENNPCPWNRGTSSAYHVRSVRCKVIEIHIARDHPKETEIVVYHRDKGKVTNINLFLRTSDIAMGCQHPVGRSAQHTLDKIRNELVKGINHYDFTYFSSDMGRGDRYRDHRSKHLVRWLDSSSTIGCALAGAREALTRRDNPILSLHLWIIPFADSIMPPV